MEAKFKKIINPADSSFIVRTDHLPLKNLWHYHPECEMLFFLDAKGTRFIGDSIENINTGEIVLLGQNLPHVIHRDREYYETHQDITPTMIVIQFDKDFLGTDIWNKNEFFHIAELLNKASRGLRFSGEITKLVSAMILKMAEQKGVRKIMTLLCILEELAHSQQINYISSCGFLKHYEETNEKINKVYEYTINNFREDISLEKISGLVYLSQSAFCRYFKNCTAKTYSQFLAEVRIGYACKLLLQEKLNISEICYECGYKNLSNFNRHFKEIMRITPSEYLRNFENVQEGEYRYVA